MQSTRCSQSANLSIISNQLMSARDQLKAIINTQLEYFLYVRDKSQMSRQQFWSIFDEVARENYKKDYDRNSNLPLIRAPEVQRHLKRPELAELKLGDFRVLKQLGEGSYGAVSIAVHKRTGFVAALKTIQKAKLTKKLKERLLAEIKIGLYIDHPNVVQMYGVFQGEGKIYILMELMETSLSKIMFKRNYQHFDEKTAGKILYDISKGMNYLHNKVQIIHRDIKPENIVSFCGVFKICDFGLSITIKSNRNTYCGTMIYMAPEVINQKGYSTPVDIWALGIIAYELMVCNKRLEKNGVLLMQQEISEGQFFLPISLSVDARLLIYDQLKTEANSRSTAYKIENGTFFKRLELTQEIDPNINR